LAAAILSHPHARAPLHAPRSAQQLQARIDVRKRTEAALRIQRSYREWQARRSAQHRAGQIGAGLVMDSMAVLRVSGPGCGDTWGRKLQRGGCEDLCGPGHRL